MSGAGFTMTVDTRAGRQLVQALPGRLDAGLGAAAHAIAAAVKRSFDTSPPGRAYHWRSGMRYASLPGYPPNVASGALRASINVARLGHLHYAVHDGVPYGVFLELGTSRMAARPFMVPVFEAWRRRLAEFLREHIVI
jgi:hypothetical protein